MNDQYAVARQYRKKGKPVWDSCGEFTYDKFKNDAEYETRRLVVHPDDLDGFTPHKDNRCDMAGLKNCN